MLFPKYIPTFSRHSRDKVQGAAQAIQQALCSRGRSYGAMTFTPSTVVLLTITAEFPFSRL